MNKRLRTGLLFLHWHEQVLFLSSSGKITSVQPVLHLYTFTTLVCVMMTVVYAHTRSRIVELIGSGGDLLDVA